MAGARELPRAVCGGIEIQAADLASSAVTTAKIAACAVTAAKVEDGMPEWVTVTLTNAQVLALRATPVQLVAAPGAGKVLELISATLFFDYTAAYTESDDNLAIKYENGSGAQASNAIETTNFLTATADTLYTAYGNTGASLIVAKSGCENKALVLHNTGDGEFGGGNASNALRVNVCFRTLSTGW